MVASPEPQNLEVGEKLSPGQAGYIDQPNPGALGESERPCLSIDRERGEQLASTLGLPINVHTCTYTRLHQ